VIPVVSVQLIKKHKTARLLPNGLAITTNASRKVTPALRASVPGLAVAQPRRGDALVRAGCGWRAGIKV